MGPSKTPNAIEREWMNRITDYGCIACRMEGNYRTAAVHHITRGRRLGHLFTLPLCDPGHHKQGAHLGMVSFHDRRKTFERMYGTELELLAKLKTELGYFDKWEMV